MISDAIKSLETYLVQFPDLLKSIEIADFEEKPNINKWSKKEILGHLIDSAVNNLSRFIVAQYQDNPIIQYDQDQWCKCNHYQSADRNHLIVLWESVNRQLLFIWRQLTPQELTRTANGQTLDFLINDYVFHFEHHLKQFNGTR